MLEHVEESPLYRLKHALVFELGETCPRLHNLTDVLFLFNFSEAVNPVLLPDLEAAVHRLRMNVEQNSVISQRAMDSSQGVHDALQRNASQRVREDSHTKAVPRDGRFVDVLRLENDLASKLSRSGVARLVDRLLVGIKSENRRRPFGVTPCHPPVPAAHLQHVLTRKVNEIMNGVDLMAFRID
jgi:hypothetical protein